LRREKKTFGKNPGIFTDDIPESEAKKKEIQEASQGIQGCRPSREICKEGKTLTSGYSIDCNHGEVSKQVRIKEGKNLSYT